MKFKVILGIMLALLPISLLVLTLNFQLVEAAGSPVVSLNPLDSTVQLGDSFTINVTVTGVIDLGVWEFKLDYNTTILDAVSVSPTIHTANNTDWMPVDALGIFRPDGPPTINDTLGRVWVGALVPAPLGGGLNGSFSLVTINFTATAAGSCTLDLYETVLGDSWGNLIGNTVINGSVTVTTSPDITPPTWANTGTNNTVSGKSTLFHVKWIDNVKLSGFVFGTNNTGTWANDTWTSMSGTTDWSNVTKTLTSSPSVVVQWRVWANDASNNWNDTGILSLNTISLQPPHAEFTYSPLTPYTGENVIFDTTPSYDPDGTIVSYAWDFGDNTNATGATTSHSYADNGIYTVTLNVTDNDGLSDIFSANVTVLNTSPVVSFTENATTVLTGEFIQFDASSSFDPDGVIVSYFWTFGDGANATSVTTSHSYADDGIYTVNLTIEDDDGAKNSTSVTKTVLNRSPVADANGPYSGHEGSPITFDASGSTDVDGTIVLYEWDWNNDSSYDESTISPFIDHIWTSNYTGAVELRVTDDDGLTSTHSASVTVLADTTAPDISTPTQNPLVNQVQPNQKVTVSVEVTDGQSGVHEVILYYKYSTDEGQTWTTWTYVTMSKATGDTYEEEIPGVSAGTRVQYGINALDKAGNTATNNNAGSYYIYTVIPEFSSWIAWILVIAITSLAVFLGFRKLQSRKHARTATHVNSSKTRSFKILRIGSSCLSTLISSNEPYYVFQNKPLL